MSLPAEIEMKCANCGHISEFHGWGTFSSPQHSELDTRIQTEYLSQSIPWAYLCINCGYCSSDLEKWNSTRDATVNSLEYKRQLFDRSFPILVNQFLCTSLIYEKENDLTNAGWNALFASWVCDDNQWLEESKKCRRKAIELFQLAVALGEKVFKDANDFFGFIADLYRRIEEFDKAKKICEVSMLKDLNEVQRSILRFELKLIDDKDSSRYSRKDAESYAYF